MPENVVAVCGYYVTSFLYMKIDIKLRLKSSLFSGEVLRVEVVSSTGTSTTIALL